MNKKQFFLHAVIFLFLVVELTAFLKPAFQVGSFFDLNIHQVSYIFYISIQIVLLQASMFLEQKNYKFVLYMLFAHSLSSSVFLYFEHYWMQIGMDATQFYYILQILTMAPYLVVLVAFHKLFSQKLYKLMSFNYLTSLLLVVFYAFFPDADGNFFIATSVAVYFLYCTQVLAICVKAYVAAFDKERNKDISHINNSAFNL